MGAGQDVSLGSKKSFGTQTEPVINPPKLGFGDKEVSSIAQLLAVALNSTQLILCISTLMQSQVCSQDAPQINDIYKINKFFSSVTNMGAYPTNGLDTNQSNYLKYMSYREKIDHIEKEI